MAAPGDQDPRAPAPSGAPRAPASSSNRAPAPTPPIADYHIHTLFSDGNDSPAACIERAVELGLPELGFSDHLNPPCLAEKGYSGIDRARRDDYVAAVRAAAARYPEIRVLVGVEADFLPEHTDEIFALLADGAFDYVLCSIHSVPGFGSIEVRPRDGEGWRDVDDMYRRYYQTVAEAAATGRFDVVSHLDLPKKWGYRPSAWVTTFEDEALRAISDAGMAIEINTGGLTDPIGEMYPSPSLLERARRAGIGLVFSSDAHEVGEIAGQFALATQLARQAGYTELLRLSDRRRVGFPQAG